MKKYPLTIKQCISQLRNKASNIKYAEIEGLLTWSAGYLEELLKEYNKIKYNSENFGIIDSSKEKLNENLCYFKIDVEEIRKNAGKRLSEI